MPGKAESDEMVLHECSRRSREEKWAAMTEEKVKGVWCVGGGTWLLRRAGACCNQFCNPDGDRRGMLEKRAQEISAEIM